MSTIPPLDPTKNPLGSRYEGRAMLFSTPAQSVGWFFVSLAFWIVLREAAERGLTSFIFTRYKRLGALDRAVFNNTFLSFIHSAATTATSLLALYLFPGLLEDLLNADCSAGRWVVISSAGYFAYDLVDFVRFKLFLDSPSIYAHHAVVLTVLYFVVTTGRFTTYVLVTLVCEANSIHLHARTMIRLLRLEHRKRYFLLNWVFLMPTLIVTRILLGAWVLFRLYSDRSRFDAEGLSMYWGVGMLGQVVINLLNWGLLMALAWDDVRIFRLHVWRIVGEDGRILRDFKTVVVDARDPSSPSVGTMDGSDDEDRDDIDDGKAGNKSNKDKKKQN